MNYKLKDLLDIPKLRKLLDSLDEIHSMPSAIIDTEGNILTATSWQDICTKFHRVSPQTEKKCIESDRHIKAELGANTPYVIYRCPMGLVDAAVPIIIDGQHLGNVFTGQLFMEPPDEGYFVKQARQYGFDETGYLEAMRKVPLLSKEGLRKHLNIIHSLVQMQADYGLQHKLQDIAEDELRESREKYQQIFENLQEVYYEASLQGEFLEVSPSVKSLSQYTREDLIGTSLFELYVHPEKREELLEKILSQGSVKNHKVHLKDKDGSQRLCSVSTMLIKDDSGAPLKLIGSMRDMSESERAEEALRAQVKEYEASQKLLKESEDRFRALSDASFGGIGIHDKGLILDCNQGLSEMTGFSIEELIGMNGLDLIAPDSLNLVLQNIKSGYAERYEAEGVRRDGSIYPLAIKGKNVQYQGREVRVIEFRDISQRKHTEEKLRKSESKQRAMLENIVDVIAIIDQNGINRFKSSNIEKLFGWKSDELVGVTFWGNIHPDDLQHTQKVFAEILDKADVPITTECRYRCKDGSYKWTELTGVNRLHDPDISGILLSYNNIEERKNHEKEHLRIEKLESIGVLAGGIAHDFNNILAGLYGNISLAKVKLEKDHPVFRYLEAAEKSMNRATLLTNQLLTFAKGGAPLKENLSLKDLIEEVVHFSLSGSNVKPIITQTDNMWLAKVDQGQIQQVFGNLTINAKQAMPDGGHLHISMKNIDVSTNSVANLDTGPYLQVTVTDEGTGIFPEHLSKIFDPYFTTKQAGSGLGLATTYSIVKRHGGHLSVTSEVGKGTTFTLYLPAAKTQNLSLTPEIKPSNRKPGTRVLVMDDEEMILSMATDMLEEMSFTVDTAADGLQVLEMYQQAMGTDDPFGLVLLDMTIPGGMGGEEAAKKILAIDPEANLIVSSGYTADPVMANYTEHGFRGVIAKPYSFTKLSEVLNRVLDTEE